MAVDDLHGLWSVRGRWFYCSGSGVDEGPARKRTAGDRLYMFGLWVLMGLASLSPRCCICSPMRAFNSLNRVVLPALSNEMPAVGVFCGRRIGWLLAVLKAAAGTAHTLADYHDGTGRRLPG